MAPNAIVPMLEESAKSHILSSTIQSDCKLDTDSWIATTTV